MGAEPGARGRRGAHLARGGGALLARRARKALHAKEIAVSGIESRPNVLFLCTGNSCRSQMAEGFLREDGGDRFTAYSAGTDPAERVHPVAVHVMSCVGVLLRFVCLCVCDLLRRGVLCVAVLCCGVV